MIFPASATCLWSGMEQDCCVERKGPPLHSDWSRPCAIRQSQSGIGWPITDVTKLLNFRTMYRPEKQVYERSLHQIRETGPPPPTGLPPIDRGSVRTQKMN